jgi:hypothetical protein
LARYKVLKVGRPLNIEELKNSPRRRGRTANPRDEELKVLINEVSAGPESQVIPWELGTQKVATARVAANKVIKGLEARVYVSTHRDYPGALLFSRQPLSGRAKRR